MGIVTKEIEINPTGKMIKYYKDLGYDAKWHESLVVKVEDLPNGSHVYLNVKCDICGDIRKIKYKDYNKIISNGGYYCCHNCFIYKATETNRLKYGCDNAMQNKEIYNKQSNSLRQRYGVTTPLKSEEIKSKVENTLLENWGVKCSFLSEDIQNKIYERLMIKYGYTNPAKSPEVREKMSRTLYENSSQMCSKQQLYIFNLYKMTNDIVELNYPISYYSADICFPEEKLDIEYDGGFHNGQVKTGKLTQEEFDQKEIIRNNIIKRAGYKQMRIISSKDKLPSDTILLQMLSDAHAYFSQYPNHSWIEFNINTSTVRNAEYKDGLPYSFGPLRTIKDSDFEIAV